MEVSCKVTLLQYTPFSEDLIASAAKLCYSGATIESITEKAKEDDNGKYINKLMSMGHESPFEHASFTFGIEGVSRSFLAQITRHRIASYSVQSQRYVESGDEGTFQFVIPPSIKKYPSLELLYKESMDNAIKTYNLLADNLEEKYLEENPNCTDKQASAFRKKAIEDARFVLPNAAETKMIATFNARSLFNFFRLRCCNRAQWEIREVAMQMYKLVYAIYPDIFKHAGPSCVSYGSCHEGCFTCGKPDIVRHEFYALKGEIDNGKVNTD